MDFFDYINKGNEKIDSEEILDKENFRKPEIRNGELLRVYDENIENGVYVIPDEITVIGNDAFWNCKNIRKIILNEKVKKIQKYAFKNCETLQEVAGLEKCNLIKTIYGFEGCKKLKKIIIPDSVELFAENAFKDCESLKYINIPCKCWAISNSAFENCKSLTNVVLPADINFIGKNTFKNCTNLIVTFDDKKKTIIQDKQKNKDGESKTEYTNQNYFLFEGNIINNVFERTTILKDAFEGVKEVVSHNMKNAAEVIDSGFKGQLTYYDDENKRTTSISINDLENQEKEASKNEIENEKN